MSDQLILAMALIVWLALAWDHRDHPHLFEDEE